MTVAMIVCSASLHGQDFTWTLTGVPTNIDLYWHSVASSSDGTKLVAARGGGIFTSTNSGMTWNLTSAPSNQNWGSVASSSGGDKLVAAGNGGIYTSTNAGTTWVKTSAPTSVSWASTVASSADGTRLVVVTYNGGDNDGIFTSANAGMTWTKTSAPINTDYYSVASSADGIRLVAAAYGCGIYISANSGRTWTKAKTSSTNWTSVASSSNGTILVAIAYNGGKDDGIYASFNSGATWTKTSAPTSTNWYWICVALSPDGTNRSRQVVVESTSQQIQEPFGRKPARQPQFGRLSHHHLTETHWWP